MNSGFGVNQLISPPMETAVSSITGKSSERTDPNSSLDTSEVLGAIGKGLTMADAKRRLDGQDRPSNVQTEQERLASDEDSNRATLDLEINELQGGSRTYANHKPQFSTEQFQNQPERSSKANALTYQPPEPVFAGKEPTFAPAATGNGDLPATNDKLLFEPIFDDCFDGPLLDDEEKQQLAPSKSAHFNIPMGECFPDGSRLTWNNYHTQIGALSGNNEQGQYHTESAAADRFREENRTQMGGYGVPRLNHLPRPVDTLISGVDCEELEGGSSNRNLPTFGKGSFRSSKSGSRGQQRSNSANREQHTRYHQRLPGGQIDELMYQNRAQDNAANHSLLDLSNQSQLAEVTDRQYLEDYDDRHYASQREADDSTDDGTLFYIKVIDFQNNERLLQITKYDDYKTTVARFFHEQHIYDVALMICLQKRIQREIERYKSRNGNKADDTQASAGKLAPLQPSQHHSQQSRGFDRQNLRLETEVSNKPSHHGAKLPPRAGVSPSSSTGKRQFVPAVGLVQTPEPTSERASPAVDNQNKSLNQKSPTPLDRMRMHKKSEISYQSTSLIPDHKTINHASQSQNMSGQYDNEIWRQYTAPSVLRNQNSNPKNIKMTHSESSGLARFLAKESETIMKTQISDHGGPEHTSTERIMIYQDQKPSSFPAQSANQAKIEVNNQDAFQSGPQQANSPIAMLEKKTPPAYLQATPGFCLDHKRASHDLTISSKGASTKRVLTFGGSKAPSNTSSSLTGSQSGLGLGKENSRLLANKKQDPLLQSTSSVRNVFKQVDNGLSNSTYFENSKKTQQTYTNNSSSNHNQYQIPKASILTKKPPTAQTASTTSGSSAHGLSSGLSFLARKDSTTAISKQLSSGSKPTQTNKTSTWAADQGHSTLNSSQIKHKPTPAAHIPVGLQSQRNLRSSFTLSQSFSGAQPTISPKPAPATSRVAGSSPTPYQASKQPAASSSLQSKYAVLAPSQLLALRSLFSKLDGDMDGVISSDRISLLTHSTEVVRAFEPLLSEIKKNPGRPYDYPMFEEAMRRMKLVPEAVRVYQKLTKAS